MHFSLFELVKYGFSNGLGVDERLIVSLQDARPVPQGSHLLPFYW